MMTDCPHFNQALALFKQERYQEAIPHFLAAINGRHGHWQAVWRLVKAAQACGNEDEVTRKALEAVAEAQRQHLAGLLQEARNNLATPSLGLKSVKLANLRLNPAFLRELAQKLEADTFVETGTFLGDTAALASDIFLEVHTIELSPELYHNAKQRFAETKSVTVYQGDSSHVLNEVLPGIKGRALFWLDGHYSMGITAKGAKNTPIIEELRAIRTHLSIDPVILVDDLRCFLSEASIKTGSLEGYPSVSRVRQEISSIYKAPRFLVAGDVSIAYDASHPIAPSPVLEACTVSRTFEGPAGVAEAIAAEELISEATGEELATLMTLPQLYAGDEEAGLCGHYRLWKGLVSAVSGNPAQACLELSRAQELDCNHWRLNWYYAQAAHACGLREEAETALSLVLREAPDFEEARSFLQSLSQT